MTDESSRVRVSTLSGASDLSVFVTNARCHLKLTSVCFVRLLLAKAGKGESVFLVIIVIIFILDTAIPVHTGNVNRILVTKIVYLYHVLKSIHNILVKSGLL
jgi:hypothetical protein